MKKARLWYVIADGGRARFVARGEDGAFRTVQSFVAAELHQRSRDLGLDRPARVLTELKHSLGKPVADTVVSDLQKDLTKVPDHDLGAHLVTAL